MNISQRNENITLTGSNEKLAILHISDIHVMDSTRILGHLATLIKNSNPDLILMTGDYYDTPKGAYCFREFLLNISKDYLILFIWGNHDKMYGKKISNLLLDIPNCICVENEIYRHRSRRGNMYNITSWKNRKDLPKDKNEINIILIHNPERIKEDELDGIHLILAGHLHGGQFRFFKTKKGSYFPGNMLYKYCTDRKQINNTSLIVSRGLGDTFPFRWNCLKEVVLLQIN